jgi:hypothetical protein
VVRHELLDVLLFFPSFCVAEEFGEIDGIVAYGIFVYVHQFRAL